MREYSGNKVCRPIGAVILALILALAPAVVPARAAEDILQAVVGLRAEIPPDARTASFLGTDRQGSGIVIDDDGLILTIGYLILESAGAIITVTGGKKVPATFVAYDHETGFGLLRATRPLGVKPMRLGKSSQLSRSDRVLVASLGGPNPVIPARVVSRRRFVGYWEYMLDNAIFTSPPHFFHSGAALVGEDGRLLGVGSLLVNNATAGASPVPGNMFVPIDSLKPVLADLLENGRRSGPRRPWIGVNTAEFHGRVIVNRITRGGPAAQAGLRAGDIILGVNDEAIRDQADFYRKVWQAGEAGTVIALSILPAGGGTLSIEKKAVRSGSRYDWLKSSRDGL